MWIGSIGAGVAIQPPGNLSELDYKINTKSSRKESGMCKVIPRPVAGVSSL